MNYLDSSKRFDYLIVGATGQIGRHLLNLTVNSGSTVAVWSRRPLDELNRQLGLKPDHYTSVIGHFPRVNLPVADHIINAAGNSRWDASSDEYNHDNIALTSFLTKHAAQTDGRLHQLSTMAIAADIDESSVWLDDAVDGARYAALAAAAIPYLAPYPRSKLLSELVALQVPSTRIYRLCDVVPYLTQDVRRTHWLTAMYAYYVSGIIPNARRFYIARDIEIAHAILTLTVSSRHLHHVLGNVYEWGAIAPRSVREPPIAAQNTIAWLARTVCEGRPLPDRIIAPYTNQELRSLGFRFVPLSSEYWEWFTAVVRSKREETNAQPRTATLAPVWHVDT